MTHPSAEHAPVCIYTLGRFDVVVHGESLTWGRQAAPKPLELLKALLAQGARGISQTALCDLLWPRAEGDNAYRALITTVYRLRRQLRCPAAIEFRNGQLGIDAKHCWVDAWHFESGLVKDSEVDELQSAIALYRGPFLVDEDHLYAFEVRERLQRKLVRAALTLGRTYLQTSNVDAAIALFEQVLDAGVLSEEVHGELMQCLASAGRNAAAVEIYERCRTLLAERLGVAPSATTQELYRALRVTELLPTAG